MAGYDLTRQRRSREIDALADAPPVDVLVVGGGVTGAGIALDAATRGLTVVLAEAQDLAFGTSRWSSKLAHGGLRYLAHGDVGVAWESAVERGHLMGTIAPHLVRPLPHVMPAFADTRITDRVLVRAGLAAADMLRTAARTPRGTLARARSVGPDVVTRLVPRIAASRLRGGTVHWDGQLVDDARLVLAIARTAAFYGAHILTRLRVSDVTADGCLSIDTVTGSAIALRARHVIVAAGVWTEELDPDTHIVTSRGSHAVLRPGALGDARAALTVPVPGERGRYVFALPTSDGPVIAGITDEPVDGPLPDVPLAPAPDISWILEHLSSALEAPLSNDDVIGTYAGLRPLVAPENRDGGDHSAETADISRRHLIRRRDDGVVVVTGGKLTTYRRMAQDALDAAGIDGAGPCVTSRTPIVGAQPYATPAPAGVPERLVRHYGREAPRVVALAERDQRLLEPLAPDVPVLGVEIAFAILAEGALSMGDILERRTRLAVTPALLDEARPRAAEIAGALDAELDPS